MAITLSEAAARHVQKALTSRGRGVGLRLGVRPSGCAGLSYLLEFADQVGTDDLSFESGGVTVLVDAASLIHVDGTELDFVREGLNEGFKFNNPNAKGECGCGESFNA